MQQRVVAFILFVRSKKLSLREKNIVSKVQKQGIVAKYPAALQGLYL